MKCSQCKIDKLSKEFPPTMITERCNHVASVCLGCLVEKLDLTNTTNKGTRKCPGPDCAEQLSPDEEELLLLAWNKASFKIDVENIGKVEIPQNTDAVDGNNKTGEIHIVLLNGQKSSLQLDKINNIPMLRQKIKEKLKVDEGKQKLIYNGVELQDRKTGMTPYTLQDYKIGPGSHIQLIVVLYNITSAESIKDLVFDLFWGFPTGKEIDYLDGSCLLYKGAEFFRKYDYASQYYPSFPHMKHSGDKMDEANRKGHQCIEAQLDKLPIEVTQLYFVLSSFKSESIAEFQNPSFKLVDKTQPDKPLCTYQLENAADQSVIMCCVSRISQGWEVIQIGRSGKGNVEDYDKIETNISQCLLSG